MDIELLIKDKKDVEPVNAILKSTFAIYMFRGNISFHKVIKKIGRNEGIILDTLNKNPKIKSEIDNVFKVIQEVNGKKDKSARIEFLNQTFPNIKIIKDFTEAYSDSITVNNMQKIYNSISKNISQEKKSKSKNRAAEKAD